MGKMLTIRHFDRQILHCEIELKGDVLKEAREAKMAFSEDDRDLCLIVFGDKADEGKPHNPPYIFSPEVNMPAVVWKTLLESSRYKRTLGAMVQQGTLVSYQH